MPRHKGRVSPVSRREHQDHNGTSRSEAGQRHIGYRCPSVGERGSPPVAAHAWLGRLGPKAPLPPCVYYWQCWQCIELLNAVSKYAPANTTNTANTASVRVLLVPGDLLRYCPPPVVVATTNFP